MGDLVSIPGGAVSIFDAGPKQKVALFKEMADVLKDVIDRQGMFSNIQGKKYVKVDAWLTLGTMLSILPREKHVTELDDGSFVAEVELVNFKTGQVVGGASALCSVDEKRWGNADKYARRSMAVTRATGKAYRLAFSWVIMMAGYEPTPEEEMPGSGDRADKTHDLYTGTIDQEKQLAGYLEKKGVNPVFFEAIGEKLKGRSKKEVDKVIQEVMQ